MNSIKPNSLSFKYQRFTPLGCKDIGMRKCVKNSFPNCDCLIYFSSQIRNGDIFKV